MIWGGEASVNLCFAVSYLDRVHGVHHCVLQYASHCSRCHVGRHGDMRWQALVVPVTVERLLVFAFVLRHIQRCHHTVRAQLHAWGALPEALPYQTTLKRGNGGMDNHNIITTGVPAPMWRNDRGRGCINMDHSRFMSLMFGRDLCFRRPMKTFHARFFSHSTAPLLQVVHPCWISFSVFEWVWQKCNLIVQLD